MVQRAVRFWEQRTGMYYAGTKATFSGYGCASSADSADGYATSRTTKKISPMLSSRLHALQRLNTCSVSCGVTCTSLGQFLAGAQLNIVRRQHWYCRCAASLHWNSRCLHERCPRATQLSSISNTTHRWREVARLWSPTRCRWRLRHCGAAGAVAGTFPPQGSADDFLRCHSGCIADRRTQSMRQPCFDIGKAAVGVFTAYAAAGCTVQSSTSRPAYAVHIPS